MATRVIGEYHFVFTDERAVDGKKPLRSSNAISGAERQASGGTTSVAGVAMGTRFLTRAARNTRTLNTWYGSKKEGTFSGRQFDPETGKLGEFQDIQGYFDSQIDWGKLGVSAGIALSTGWRITNLALDISAQNRATIETLRGNALAAQHIANKRAKQQYYSNVGLDIVRSVTVATALGAKFGAGIGAGIGAVAGLAISASMQIARQATDFNNQMKVWKQSLIDQQYTGALTSRRLVNTTGRTR